MIRHKSLFKNIMLNINLKIMNNNCEFCIIKIKAFNSFMKRGRGSKKTRNCGEKERGRGREREWESGKGTELERVIERGKEREGEREERRTDVKHCITTGCTWYDK
jgi:hypothetical protein